MENTIKSIHFDATEKLQELIPTKLNRLSRHFENATKAEVNLTVVKPETANNKEAAIKLTVPEQGELFASKIADTFEEAVDVAIEALERQLEKIKARK